MKIGYARVSTTSQSLDLQLKALHKVGCEKIYREKVSGVKAHRKEFEVMMEFGREGDQIVVTRLDRLSRSAYELQTTSKTLERKGVSLVVLERDIDTSSPAGKLMFHMIAAIAEFERSIINERSEAGRRAAQERGVKFGRGVKLSNEDVVSIRNLIEMGECVSSLAQSYSVNRTTIYRAIERAK
ncbi:recombinase family protein [Sulfuricurvum sp.]|nr:recombinase family protein [Sulfuricurvum sp.]MDD2368512.1 recombinase family protein [Sulfuricurvum sp.]MDD2949534.1 recombinase family protein [Sulfuricurvum sp.]MDD3596790.1 recombinase family protein [Sulfuricurvum sp.]MDD5118149.1 recombinase family protein [Sulfuricurvum sp.]